MALVYSMFAFTVPLVLPRLSVPSENPLLAEICFVLGLLARVTIYGVTPLRVLIFTIPELMSPYSAEGTPEMTSTDSMSLDDILLVATPAGSSKLPLLDSLTPSTSTAVPKVGLPASAAPPVLMLNLCSDTSDGLVVTPPGRRAEMSATFMACTWSRAVLSIIRLVVALLSFDCAVTTTLSRARLSSSRYAV